MKNLKQTIMKNLKQSSIKAIGDYIFYDIPNVDNVMISIHTCGDIDLVGQCNPRGIWFRLGDRPDLKPDILKDIKGWCNRDNSEAEKEAYIKKVVEIFA